MLNFELSYFYIFCSMFNLNIIIIKNINLNNIIIVVKYKIHIND